ncbi:NAD-dependent nucleoside diphosphate-sugar epimerase/dehydratase [Syntrophotalea carbinolica DSM 2380]|uniref:NAD-dependent nucleoside diphosphate-sugar epimerase/dehydratase n=1 Tax=Syntrophotalea carbinolica (strain DSM 2380 / NBRC 103641 / GraBd1) TaxID=338963 RepID=Q3A2B7_SYNC1|nr:NAD-dependent epimerase/dehydratase family protein [Syntrophotalea carbinolica]ABA89490.1 NAD-dependent nucleoside diphosphate-sugar epimerase/dehydratase [Syntrophotalea carbinolica DSM 2380]
MPRILIAGGAGFLGANLSRRLLKDNNEVVCLDNLSTGHYQNIRDLTPSPRFEFIKADIVDPINLSFDKVFNLACPASPPQYQRLALQTIDACTLGVRNLLEATRRNNARMLHASTSEVYGDPEIHPQIESYRGNVGTLTDRACYDEGKRLAETLCYEYHKRGCAVRIARLFNTYGPFMDQDDGRVVSNFTISALTEQPLTIYGDGSQTRSFCYVSDTVEALLRFMDLAGDNLPVYNLGNPREVRIVDLAHSILQLTGSNAPMHFHSLPEADPKKRKPCIKRAHQTMNWLPRVSLESGLLQTIDYFTQLLRQQTNETGLAGTA